MLWVYLGIQVPQPFTSATFQVSHIQFAKGIQENKPFTEDFSTGKSIIFFMLPNPGIPGTSIIILSISFSCIPLESLELGFILKLNKTIWIKEEKVELIFWYRSPGLLVLRKKSVNRMFVCLYVCVSVFLIADALKSKIFREQLMGLTIWILLSTWHSMSSLITTDVKT